MSWTNDSILEFLELYRREQILWDPKHPLHRNRTEINEAWDRIQSTLSIHCSINDLKRKKESLMTSFRMHFNKKRNCPDRYHISWFAYDMMESFLGCKYECDSTNQSTNNESQGGTSPYAQVIIEQRIDRSKVKPGEKRNITSVNHRQSSQTKSNHDYIYAKKEMEEDVPYVVQALDGKKEMDEYDLYGQLLAKKLRKLDEHQRDVAMHDIDNIMFRVKMQGSSSQSRNYMVSPTTGIRRPKSPVFIVTQPGQVQYEDENAPYEEHLEEESPL